MPSRNRPEPNAELKDRINNLTPGLCAGCQSKSHGLEGPWITVSWHEGKGREARMNSIIVKGWHCLRRWAQGAPLE